MPEILKAVEEAKEIKKYYTQMTQQEKNVLMMCIRGNFRITPYCLGRMQERRVSPQELDKTIREGRIIEYHLINDCDSRVLLRGRVPFRNRVTCAVVDLTYMIVVTVFKNHYCNTHESIDLTGYDSSLDILKNFRTTLN